MSQTIDEKVVALRFNNKQFKAGVESTLDDLDRLNKGLKLDGASKGLEQVAESAKNIDLSHFEVSIDKVKAKIGVFQTMVLTAVNRMSNALIDFGKTTIDNFAIKPVSTGFDEYELKMGSIQTIMASTGESLSKINKVLDELNEYSDDTIYSFQDMTESIGKFTNAGVSLQDAVLAIKGISNEAAVSGANATEASRAMYNFAQALSAGHVKFIDWRSIDFANMATVEFKNQLLQTASEMGTVSKEADGMYRVLSTNGRGSSMNAVINASRNFNESLEYRWMTTDVLIKTLAKYADEETEIGKKAYAAAKDVKTFSMMIDTLSEAAQSGWAETWQYIFGDFKEAKTLFTELSEFFGDIIESSTKARNELIGTAMRLQNAEGISGQQALWQSAINTLEHLKAVIGAVKDAFFDIFPPITAQRLRGLIEGLLEFSKNLDHSEGKLNKIRQTFRGIFAILDMFVTTIRFVGRVTINVMKAIYQFMTIVLFGGFALLMKWVDRIKQSDTGFNGWLNRIGKGIGRFAEYVKNVDELSFGNVFGALKSFGNEVIGSIFNLDGIKSAFGLFDKTVSTYVDKSSVSLKNSFNALSDGLSGSTNEAEGSMNTFVKVLTWFKDKVFGVFKALTYNLELDEFSFGKAFAVVIAASLLLVVTTTTKFANKLGKVVDKVAGVFDRFDDILENAANTIKTFGLKVKADALFTISKSIIVLTGALTILSLLNPDGLKQALIAIGLISAGLVAVSFALSKVGSTKQSISLAAIILSLSVSLQLLVGAMRSLSELGNVDIKQPFKLLGILSVGLVAATKMLGSKKERHYATLMSAISLVLSLKVLVGLLRDITKMNLQGVTSGLKVIFGLLAALTVAGLKVGKQTMGTAATIAAMVAAIKLSIGSIAELGEMDPDTVNKGILAAAKIFGAFSILLLAGALGNARLGLFQKESEEGAKKGKKASSNLKDLGNAILKISTSLFVIGAALKVFSKFTTEEIDRGTMLLGRLLILFSAIVGVSFFAGEHAAQAGKMIQQMSVAMISFVGLMALMTLYRDPSVLRGPMRIIEELMLVMGALVALSKFAADTKESTKVINALTKAVVSITIGVAALSIIKTEALQKASLAMSMVLSTFALILAVSKFAPVKTKGILSITAAVLAVNGVLMALSLLDVQNVLQNAASMSLVMSALSAAIFVVSKSKANNKGLITKLTTWTMCVGLIGGILLGMSKLGVENALQNAGAIGIVLTSLSTSIWIVSNSKDAGPKTLAKLGIFAAIVAALQIIFGGLHAMGVETALKDVASLSVIALALASAFAIFGKAGNVGWKQIAQLGAIMAATVLIGYLMQWLQLGKFEMSIKSAVSLGLLLTAVSGSLFILGKVGEVSTSAIGAAAGMSLVLGAISAVVGFLEKNDFKTSIENAASLSLMLIAVAGASLIASKAGVSAKAAFVGIGAMLTLVASMGLLMWGIGALVRDNPNVMGDLDTAVDVMGRIGLGLGSLIGEFIGGIAGGIVDGTLVKIGDSLSDFSEAIKPFLNNMSAINKTALENGGSLVGLLVKFTGADILERIGGWLGGVNSMEKFADELVHLGNGLVTFSETTQGIKRGSQVGYAIETLRRLAEAADEIPNIGGKLANWVGDNRLDVFADQFPSAGSGIVGFCDAVQNLNYGPQVDDALGILAKLAAVSNEIPNTGGLLGDLVGNNDMGPFAEQLPIIAGGILSFAYRTKNIDAGKHIQDACDAIAKVAHAAQEIPNTGGLLAHWIGDNEMGPFAEQMPIMGQGIKDFCDKVKGIDTSSVDESLAVARDIANFSKDIANTGGMWQDIWGSVSLEEFGRQLTWLGKYLWTYSTWINQIRDFSKFEKSVEAVKTLADMSEVIGKLGYVHFGNFGTELVEFAQTALLDFVTVFDNADLRGTGEDIGDQLTKGVLSTKIEFRNSATTIMKAFLENLDRKITGATDSVKSRGKEIANVLMDSIQTSLTSSDLVYNFQYVGTMVDDGVAKGVDKNAKNVAKSGQNMANGLKNAVENTLEVHSPSKWGEWIGNNIDLGVAGGLTQGSGNVLNSLGNIWDNLKSLSSEGVQGIKDVIGTKGLWDFTAPIGDNLVVAKDKFKEWLGFGNEGGLSDLFGFGSLSEELEEEIADSYEGIQNGMSDLVGNIQGSGGASMMSNLSEALKLSIHKHFDYEGFIYLGKQIGETMAIAANNAIVSNAKATGEMFAEVVSATAGGIDMWKAWAEDRKAYNKLSIKDELAGWTLVQKMYEEGTKERMEADKEVYSLQQELVKGTYEYSKNWIDTEKYYKRLSLEDELAAWERVQKRYMAGSEERIEAEKEIYRVKEELRQRDYDNAKKAIEKDKKLEKLSLAAELAAYKRLRATTQEGSDEREETDDKIFDLEKEIYEAQKEYTENVTEIQKNAQEERVKLEEEYAEKVREIEEQLASDIADANQKYADSVDQRAKSLYNAYNLFDEVQEREADKDTLLQNLQDQVYAFSNWRSEIQSLANRGLDEALIDELIEMGPSAAAEIKALNSMTDAELGQYNLLWSQKSAMAREQAISELEDLRIETVENISKLQSDASKELDEYRDTWAKSMKEITTNCSSELENLRKEFGEKVGTIQKDTEAKLREIRDTAKKILNEAGWDDTGNKLVNGVSKGITEATPSLLAKVLSLGKQAGQQTVTGVQLGIESKKPALNTTMTALGAGLIGALNAVLRIKSPSKEAFATGTYYGEGLLMALEAFQSRAYEAGYDLGYSVQNGAYEAVRYVSDALENGINYSPRIVPVIDLSNISNEVSQLDTLLDSSNVLDAALVARAKLDEHKTFELKNPNENVVSELQSLRSDITAMGEKMAKLQVVLDTGTVVGEISDPLDRNLGTKYARNSRERW